MTNNLSGYFNSNEPIEINNENWAGNIYYLTGINLPPGRKFNIHVPNGNEEVVNFNFSVNALTRETTIIGNETTETYDDIDIDQFLLNTGFLLATGSNF